MGVLGGVPVRAEAEQTVLRGVSEHADPVVPEPPYRVFNVGEGLGEHNTERADDVRIRVTASNHAQKAKVFVLELPVRLVMEGAEAVIVGAEVEHDHIGHKRAEIPRNILQFCAVHRAVREPAALVPAGEYLAGIALAVGGVAADETVAAVAEKAVVRDEELCRNAGIGLHRILGFAGELGLHIAVVHAVAAGYGVADELYLQRLLGSRSDNSSVIDLGMAYLSERERALGELDDAYRMRFGSVGADDIEAFGSLLNDLFHDDAPVTEHGDTRHITALTVVMAVRVNADSQREPAARKHEFAARARECQPQYIVSDERTPEEFYIAFIKGDSFHDVPPIKVSPHIARGDFVGADIIRPLMF